MHTILRFQAMPMPSLSLLHSVDFPNADVIVGSFLLVITLAPIYFVLYLYVWRSSLEFDTTSSADFGEAVDVRAPLYLILMFLILIMLIVLLLWHLRMS